MAVRVGEGVNEMAFVVIVRTVEALMVRLQEGYFSRRGSTGSHAFLVCCCLICLIVALGCDRVQQPHRLIDRDRQDMVPGQNSFL